MTHFIKILRPQRRTFCTYQSNCLKTWRWFISAAQQVTTMDQLKPIHAIFITHGLHNNTYAVSKLLAFCALSVSGSLPYASLLFTQISNPNSFIYNTLIRAFSRTTKPHFAIDYFNHMLQNRFNNQALCPDQHTFPFVLIACANGLFLSEGKKIHNWVLKVGLSSFDCHVQTALIRLYAACNAPNDARKVFDEIAHVDAVQCNVLISGYLKSDMASEALALFQGMLVRGVDPDEFCVASGLTACAQLGALEQGKWIHEYVMKQNWLASDVFIGTALVDMYAKCGNIDMAMEVFESMPKRNAVSWAAVIRGLATHGYAKEAILCLERMQIEDNLNPDGVVLLGVLAACAHAGLHKEGRHLLDNMEPAYGVVPEHEHYSCLVDMLCRGGKLNEAVEVIKGMPMKPKASVWGALLSGCRIHNNVVLAELAVRELLMLENGSEDEEDAAYVQLSYIYLAAQRCDAARSVRKMIGDRGLKKNPGCSAIEVDGEIHEFVSGDVSHPCLADIHAMLDLMSIDLVGGQAFLRRTTLNQTPFVSLLTLNPLDAENTTNVLYCNSIV